MPSFDPDAAARPGAGVFGLPFARDEAGIVLLPVPFDATTSYGGGASGGPEAVRAASAQVDLTDLQFGAVWRAGIYMEESPGQILALARDARAIARPIIDKGGAEEGDEAALRKVDAACERVNEHVHAETRRALDEGRIPGVVGGDHSTPFGAIRACAEHVAAGGARDGLGILQIDAHMDLREAFEGFTWSHASIMFNVLERVPGVTKLVQVGLRDVGQGEVDYAKASKGRVLPCYDLEWTRRIEQGEKFMDLVNGALATLPKNIYISFDIDGLDPSLCPGTGTPVPGGLSFNRMCLLLEALKRTGRRVVGFDLNEVSPREGDEWDANVGARALYKLCGVAAREGA